MNFYNNIEKFNGFAGPRVGITTTYYGPSSSWTTSSSSSNKTEIDKEYERLFGSNNSGSSSYTGDSSRGSSSGSSSYTRDSSRSSINSGQTQNSPKSSETTDFSQYLPLAAVGLGLLLGAVMLK